MAQKTKTELFGKHPLAKAIEPVVEEWAKAGYPPVNGRTITNVTKELLEWWSSEDAHGGEKFHICQQRALETIIYCYEILGMPSVADLFEKFSHKLLEKENLRVGVEEIKHPRFGIKMATGTGKTWVITALIIWQYWNRIRNNDKRFASHFTLCAPGNIVYDRLLDSFLGKKGNDGKRQPFTADIKKSIFMPDNWLEDFNLAVFTKEDLKEGALLREEPFVLITNWHQLTDTTKSREDTLAESMGIDIKSDNISLRVERFMNFLTYNEDMIVINDEAHHTHNATDSEQKRWQESLELLRDELRKNGNALFAQFDFTATPFTIKGKKKEYFPHVIYDYGLVEAMRARLVKQIFIEKSNLLSEKIEKLPREELGLTGHRDDAGNAIDLSATQKHMIDVGIAKLENLQEEFEKFKIKKKPVLFVVADKNDEADLVASYIKEKTDRVGMNYGEEPVVTIHEDRKNHLSDDDYEILKNKVFASDDLNNPTRVIVSVLMLREGFDVKNVCVLVVLRQSDSDLLTEQIIGRGIRLMFSEPEYAQDKEDNYQCIEKNQKLINSYDLLFVVEHPKYNEIYNQLTEAGAVIASGNSLEISLDSKSVLVEIDESRLPAFDMAWPIAISYGSEESIDFKYFNIADIPTYPVPFEQITPTRIIITDYHPDTKFKQDWELEEAIFSYNVFLMNAVRAIIGISRRNVWLSRYAAEIAGIVDRYLTEFAFGKATNFESQNNMLKLRNQQFFDFVEIETRKQLMKFVQNLKANDIVEADWAKLSDFKEIKVRMEKAIQTKMCAYPFIDFSHKGGFEKKFTEDTLESDSLVECYVKLNQYVHGFAIQYRNSLGHLVPYYPDFIVKTSGFMLIVETKSEKDARNDIDVKSKAMAAEQRCREISRARTAPPIQQPKEWRYILLSEDIYKEFEGQSLRAIIDRCDSTLALLKMRRE